MSDGVGRSGGALLCLNVQVSKFNYHVVDRHGIFHSSHFLPLGKLSKIRKVERLEREEEKRQAQAAALAAAAASGGNAPAETAKT